MHTIIPLSQADRRPMYLQIMEQIRHRVAVGDWAPGHEIPSIRALAADIKVSVITVKRAYLELEHAGIVVTRQGRGTYVAEDAQLGINLKQEELDRQLAAAVETARLLGLDEEALQQRLCEAIRKTREQTP
jgi:GntR family transcriptional regulator